MNSPEKKSFDLDKEFESARLRIHGKVDEIAKAKKLELNKDIETILSRNNPSPECP